MSTREFPVGVWRYDADSAPPEPKGPAHHRKSKIEILTASLRIADQDLAFHEIESATLTEGPRGVGVLRITTASNVFFIAFVPTKNIPEVLGVPVKRVNRPASASTRTATIVGALITLGLLGILYLVSR